ncbi:hypothetical protein ACPWSR_01090 [Alloiococcus sp. CFN-8]|uniref:hypothetical protein n=1 Tax=Alloiococcus sp. CFN-8 TaxID=3416081 RepID=UPI003CF18998
MSAFLGRIHYWLFNKIKWFEALEEKIYELAFSEGLEAMEWKKEIEDKYGHPTEHKPLEAMIDTSNIHGWLQDKIEKAEGRHAEYITRILNKKPELIEKLMELYKLQGTEDGKEYVRNNNEVSSPEEVYAAINDYILDGMPCDRINEFIERDENSFIYRATRCVHGSFWQQAKGDVKNFYRLRREWIKAFVEEAAPNLYYTLMEDGSEGILRREVI